MATGVQVVIDCADPARQAEFWAAALGYERRPTDADDFAQVVSPDRSGPSVSFDRYRGAERVPPRIHLALFTADQASEVARLEALGGRQVHWSKRPTDADYVIMEDPEGNRFCVVDVTR